MKKEYGIKNLKPIIALGIELGNVADKVGRETGAARYLGLMDLFDELMALGNVDFKMVSKEAGELDAEERLELHGFLKAKFDIVDDKLEMAIESGLSLVERQYGIVKEAMALAKSLKA